MWVKNSFVLGRQDYQWQHEPCLYGWKEGQAHYFVDDRTQTTVIEDMPDYKKMTREQLIEQLEQITAPKVETTVLREDKPVRSELHPTMKPINLCARLIRNSSKKGWKVYDGFGGSGSTLIACEQTGRKCYTMELDPHYCDVIIARWEALTGYSAVKIK